jgi:hypothetical protein
VPYAGGYVIEHTWRCYWSRFRLRVFKKAWIWYTRSYTVLLHSV